MSSIESSSLKTSIDHNVSDCDIRQTFTSVGLEESVSVLSEHVEPFLLHA